MVQVKLLGFTVVSDCEGVRYKKYAHRDDLVFVDPHHVAHTQVLPLHCAEADMTGKRTNTFCSEHPQLCSVKRLDTV